MIKFVCQIYRYIGCSEYEYHYCDSSDKCPLNGAVLEEWVEETTEQIGADYFPHQEARIDQDGKPYIYTWREYYPELAFDKFKKIGFDHTQEKIEGNPPRWIYTRIINKSVWTFTVETLEQIEDFLDKKYELGRLDTPINGIQYYIEVR